MPISPVLWNILQTGVVRKNQSCGLRTPSSQTREAIRGIANHCQIVWNRFGSDSELVDNTGFIAQEVASAIELHDARADNALTEIFVGRANEDLAHAFIAHRLCSG